MFESTVSGSNVLVQGASRSHGLGFVRQALSSPRAGHVVATCRNPAAAAVPFRGD